MRPETKEEAVKNRYGTWAGDPIGIPYKEGQCAWEVWPRDEFTWIPSQCKRPAGYGIAGLYCKQHAKRK